MQQRFEGRAAPALALALALALGATAVTTARAAGPDDLPATAAPAPLESFTPAVPTTAGPAGRLILGPAGSVEPHPGEYWGVVPGSTRPAPGRPKAKPTGIQVFAWIGFQMVDGGGSRVYVVTTNPVPHEIVETSSDKIVVELSNVRVLLSNHLRFIDTTYFTTYVRKIETTRGKKKHSVRVTIHLRAPITPSVERVGDFLFMEFPAASFSSTS